MRRAHILASAAIAVLATFLIVSKRSTNTEVEQPSASLSPAVSANSADQESPKDRPSGTPALAGDHLTLLPCPHEDPLARYASDSDDEVAMIDAWDSLRADVAGRLSESSSAEHLHVTALMESDPVTRAETITRAIARSPNDPLLLRDAVRFCHEAKGQVDCPLDEWERRLVAVDGENSESWILVAANRHAEDEKREAFAALRRAASAAESRDYWPESIELIELGLAAGSDFGFAERSGLALGLATMTYPLVGNVLSMCKDESDTSAEWAYACLDYGKLLEKQGKTEISISLAYSIQAVALTALGEEEQAATVDAKQQKRRDAWLEAAKANKEMTHYVIFSNPSLFSAYLAAVRAEGELKAQERMGAAARLALEENPRLACAPPE